MNAATRATAGFRHGDDQGRGPERSSEAERSAGAEAAAGAERAAEAEMAADAAPAAEITPADASHAGGRRLLGARIAFLAAGVLLALFPLLRPWGDKTGVDAQAVIAWSDPRWIAAHLCGLAGLSLLAGGLVLLAGAERRSRRAAMFAAIGALLVAPYFGAETFALPELARGLADSPETVVALATALRGGLVIGALFLAGLLSLAVAGVLAWRQGRRAGWAAGIGWTMAALGLVAYLPQFFAPDALRIAHGVVLGAGLLIVALVGLGAGRTTAARQENAG